jgi:hypothetical protein
MVTGHEVRSASTLSLGLTFAHDWISEIEAVGDPASLADVEALRRLR